MIEKIIGLVLFKYINLFNGHYFKDNQMFASLNMSKKKANDLHGVYIFIMYV